LEISDVATRFKARTIKAGNLFSGIQYEIGKILEKLLQNGNSLDLK
jgi:hypothetical protein